MRFSRLFFFLLLLTACTAPASPGITPPPATASVSPTVTASEGVIQPPAARLHFGRLGLEDGLSQSVILAMVQDQQGFMWFGTQDGLNRYDGKHFQVYTNAADDETSLSDVWVCALALDASGNLWAGTRQGGANRFDAQTGSFTRFWHDDADSKSISHNNVHAIFNDALSRLWFGTERGLDLFDPATGTFTTYLPPEVEGLSVRALTEDQQGYLWLGTAQGLWRFDPTTGEFTAFSVDDKRITFVNVLADPDGTLWLASNARGLFHFYPQTGAFFLYTPKEGLASVRVNALWRDPSGWLWVGTHNGLDLFDPATETFTHYRNNPLAATTISSDTVFSLYGDRSGLLWIGSFGGSISYYDPFANQFVHYYNDPKDPQSLGENSIFAIASDPDGTLWVGTLGGGLDHFDPRTGVFTHYRYEPNEPASLQSNYIYSLLPVRDGALWAGTQTGLDRLDRDTGAFTHFEHDPEDPLSLPEGAIYYLYLDTQNEIWVGSSVGGLARFNQANQAFVHIALGEDCKSPNECNISAITADHQGVLWIGTQGHGLFRYEPASGVVTRFKHVLEDSSTISNDVILTIYESERGDLWVGTAGSGLNYYDPLTESFVVYNETNGLPNNYIYGILEDDAGGLWLSTNRGLARFDPQNATVQSYTTADGLQSNEFNMGAFAEDGKGFMYFGGINGLNVFNPAALTSNRFVPPVSLVSVTQNGQPLTAESEPGSLRSITLRYPDTSFEFEFAALSYSQSEKNQYAYQLDGFDGDWYYAGSNRIGRYSNLPGGHYTLRLKAANSSGVWNEAPIAIQVIVIPPFWQTTWFYALAALTLLAGVLVVYRLRVHDVEMQKRELERQVGERTREIAQLFEKTKELAILEERNRLARDLHDSAKQKAFAALAQLGAARSLANGNLDKAAKHLQEAETLVGDVIQEITFLIQEIHPVALKEKGLAAALREYVFEWSNRTGIDVDLRFEGERALMLEVEQVLYRAIQEALANVARHSEANSVLLALKVESSEVNVTMADNGRGFDLNRSPNGMGLRSIRERVESVGGRFAIESAAGQGTRLSLRIPIG